MNLCRSRRPLLYQAPSPALNPVASLAASQDLRELASQALSLNLDVELMLIQAPKACPALAPNQAPSLKAT